MIKFQGCSSMKQYIHQGVDVGDSKVNKRKKNCKMHIIIMKRTRN